MKYFIVSNNPQVRDELGKDYDIEFVEGSYMDVLCAARDKCHLGHMLLSHPLSGSVKPNETLYKSIMLSKNIFESDADSILLIEKAIDVARKFGPIRRNWKERELLDFQYVDYTLISSAIESANENSIQT